ncbi:hypothetical protein D3C73_1412840 [compost metagenome]
MTIEEAEPQERQQHEQGPQGPRQIGARRQHQQQPGDGYPVAHGAQTQAPLALPPLHRLQPGVGAGGDGLHPGLGAAAH